MYSSAIDHGAEETLSQWGEKLLNVLRRVWELGLSVGNRLLFLRGLYSTHLQCMHIFYVLTFFSEKNFETPLAMILSANWSYCDQ